MASIATAPETVLMTSKVGHPRKSQPKLVRRFVVVSGTTEPPEYAIFLEETGVPVLGKPFSVEELQRLVERTLRDQR